MTFRPYQKALSRREATVYNKAVRALAHKGGTTAHEALGKLNGYRTTNEKAWQAYGFHPDRIHEDGLFYISHVRVDDGTLHLDDEDVYDFKVDFPAFEEQARQTNMTISLVDIAKPARRKGRTKKSVITVQAQGDADYDFEDFIELDHADAFSVFSEDWEDLCSNDGVGDEQA